MRDITGKHCAKCGYELTGLDLEGRCPECGRYFNDWTGEGIEGGRLLGYQRGDRIVGYIQAAGLVVLALLILGVGVIFTYKSQKPTPMIPTGLVALLVLIGAGVRLASMRKK